MDFAETTRRAKPLSFGSLFFLAKKREEDGFRRSYRSSETPFFWPHLFFLAKKRWVEKGGKIW